MQNSFPIAGKFGFCLGTITSPYDALSDCDQNPFKLRTRKEAAMAGYRMKGCHFTVNGCLNIVGLPLICPSLFNKLIKESDIPINVVAPLFVPLNKRIIDHVSHQGSWFTPEYLKITLI